MNYDADGSSNSNQRLPENLAERMTGSEEREIEPKRMKENGDGQKETSEGFKVTN